MTCRGSAGHRTTSPPSPTACSQAAAVRVRSSSGARCTTATTPRAAARTSPTPYSAAPSRASGSATRTAPSQFPSIRYCSTDTRTPRSAVCSTSRSRRYCTAQSSSATCPAVWASNCRRCEGQPPERSAASTRCGRSLPTACSTSSRSRKGTAAVRIRPHRTSSSVRRRSAASRSHSGCPGSIRVTGPPVAAATSRSSRAGPSARSSAVAERASTRAWCSGCSPVRPPAVSAVRGAGSRRRPSALPGRVPAARPLGRPPGRRGPRRGREHHRGHARAGEFPQRRVGAVRHRPLRAGGQDGQSRPHPGRVRGQPPAGIAPHGVVHVLRGRRRRGAGRFRRAGGVRPVRWAGGAQYRVGAGGQLAEVQHGGAAGGEAG